MVYMEYDIQQIINLVSSFLTISFPIALIMSIAIKLANIFKDFVTGRNVRL